MAYINASDVRAIRNKLKETFKNTKFSVRLSPNSHTSITVSILAAPDSFVDLPDGTPNPHSGINHFHLGNYKHSKVLEKMLEIINTAGSRPNYDKSDAMTDYFDVRYYVTMEQGTWKKPFKKVPTKKGK